MVIPKNFDEVKAVNSNSVYPTLGGHCCKINGAEEYINRDGKQSIKITVDIEEYGEFDGYFSENAFESNGLLIWPQGGTKYLSMEERNMPYFKQFIEAINASNDVKTDIYGGIDIDVSQFIGLNVACQFGIEEYEKDGIVRKGLKICNFYPVTEIENIPVPKVRLLDGSLIEYEKYLNLNKENID